MSVPSAKKAGSRFQMFQGILPVDGSQVPSEIVAGITLAALAIPEVMGYTKISGTPVITGLYTILIPTALFAVFGSSRHLVVGADSATAAILAASLVGIASTGSEHYVALAGAKDVAKVSVIGVGMRSHAGVAAKGFRALADKGVNIRAISTSEIKFSVLIDAEVEGEKLDQLELDLIDHGLEEMGESSGEKGEPQLVIRCAFTDFGLLQKALEDRGIVPLSAEREFVCRTPTELPEEQAKEVLELIDQLEQDDDVQKVFHTLA